MSPDTPLATVIEAARHHAARLRAIAENPFGLANLPASTSAKATAAFVARHRAEAEAIEAAIAELRDEPRAVVGGSGPTPSEAVANVREHEGGQR